MISVNIIQNETRQWAIRILIETLEREAAIHRLVCTVALSIVQYLVYMALAVARVLNVICVL